MTTHPFTCRIRAEAGTTRMDILDDIGEDPWFGGGISAAAVVDQLSGLRGPLDVHISSQGGMVGEGLAIFNALAAYPGRVTTYNDGIAASVASVIMQAGAHRVASPVSVLMVHDAWGDPGPGNAADMQAMADALSKNSDVIARAYADRAGGTVEDWRSVMQATRWYDADEALAAGLVDEVAGGSRLPAPVDIGALAAARAPARIVARLRAAAGDDSGDGPPACKTCGGSGRLKHPGTGKAGVKCPGCGGSGVYDPDDDGDDDSSAGGDTDHDYVEPDGSPGPKALTEERVRAIWREEAARAAAAVRDSLPDDVKSKFLADLKDDTPVDIAAGMRRLSQWAASGSYPTGCAYADLKWFYDQCAAELQSRDPDSDAGGNFPPEKGASDALRGPRVMNCHALMTALETLRQAAGDDGASDSAGKGIHAADAVERFRAAMPALKGVRA